MESGREARKPDRRMMGLPDCFDRFVEALGRCNDEQLQFNWRQSQFDARVDQFMVRTGDRFARFDEVTAQGRPWLENRHRDNQVMKLG